ncbi:MAG: glycerol-3-phosphate 1-O-acyltransferase PlsY [Ahrensia sp.]|nr:glycerol-3-phosphate 1-O-acyltransferase PlsY [Ahrensia sp.]
MEPGTATPLAALASLILGYGLGSIPFGLLITRFGGAGDVRTIGSGNIGATNVLRTGKKGLAAATLLCDALKGTFAVLLSVALLGLAIPAALGAFLGHLFPVWLRFRGGKGIATFVGLLLAFSWAALLTFAVVWIGMAAITRYSSLAALCATVCSTIAIYVADLPMVAALFGLLTLISFVMHRENISRLLAGTESKIGAKG